MSKAFTRESDDADEPALARLPSPLPPGVKNYITPDGERRLREELNRLMQIERPRFAGSPELRRELQLCNQRIAALDRSLQSVVVVPPPATPDNQIRFGASIMVRDKGGEESHYRIVGIDEMEVDRGWISWRSPLARALINTRVGQRVRVRLPGGEEELEIISVSYD